MTATKIARGVEDALENGYERVVITINPKKPRKGVLEVRVGEIVIASTGPESRPFPALKALDIEWVARSTADTAISAYLLG